MTRRDEKEGKVCVLEPYFRFCLGLALLILGQTEHVVCCFHVLESGNIFLFPPLSLSKKLIKAQDFLRSFNDMVRIVINWVT